MPELHYIGKMIQSSERMIEQEIVYAYSIDFSKTGLCGLF
jgi:hypothetical protein